jgi:glycosyltransferase involved in cell wall biosynthesis
MGFFGFWDQGSESILILDFNKMSAICRFNLVNNANVIGGQEIYLKRLGLWLRGRGYRVSYIGEPDIGLSGAGVNASDLASVVNIYNGNSALYSTLRESVNGLVNVYVHHSDINDNQQALWRRWVRKILVKLLLVRFDLVVRVCNKALPDWYAPNKIVTIYNGIDIEPSVVPRAPRSATKWLMVGGVTENKNQKLAIEALVQCPEATLTIVGDGPAKAALEAYCAELGVTSRVLWVGFVENPGCYYEVCDVLLVLSHYEAFPYVVLEAMAKGMPVLAVPVGGVPEILSEHNGILLHSSEKKEVIYALKKLAASPEDYASVSEQGIRTIRERFTQDQCFEQLVGHIERVMKLKKRGEN